MRVRSIGLRRVFLVISVICGAFGVAAAFPSSYSVFDPPSTTRLVVITALAISGGFIGSYLLLNVAASLIQWIWDGFAKDFKRKGNKE